MSLERAIEEIIEEAMAAGDFDQLPGRGRPLDLEENPYEDPSWRIANRLLRQNGFSWPWMEERKEVETALAAARERLTLAWSYRQHTVAAGQPENSADTRWQQANTLFRQQVEELNGRIQTLNLKVPAASFQRLLIDVDGEIQRVSGR
ncbi:MAG: DnaJ family domain-containing protein [Chloroflexota bacterium]